MSLRITTRLIAAWTLSGLIVFGGYGIFLVWAERAELRAAVEREMLLLGSSVQVAIENAMRDGQLDDVDETASILEDIDRTVDVFVHEEDHSVLLSTGRVEGAHRAWLRLAGDEPSLHWIEDAAPPRLLMVATLQEEGAESPYGTLVVSRSLADVQQDLSKTTASAATTVVVFVITSAFLGWLLGTSYIGRPLASMAQAMQRVRGGDMEPGLHIQRDDEVGALAGEFNLMMAELRDARRRLREEAEARQSLQRALQQADKLITLGQLAATVAHEIGSPLQVLHGRARALQRHANQPDAVRRHADILVRETDRVARIVEQLLSTTRNRPPARVPVDLAVRVRQAVELLDLVARRQGVEVLIRGEDPLVIEGDPDGLQQVVVNLLSNALAATPSGGQVEITLASLHDPPRAELTVRDSGSGMTPGVEARMFEAFFTTRADEGGTGLGTVVIRRIVEAHDGRISVRTAPDAGTTVTVHLPRKGPGGTS